jgi:hypothetical protein
MATVYSTQRTNSRATPVVMNKTNEMGGRVRVAHGVYEASALAADDVIEMFRLPDGARILTGSLAHDALGASTQLSVGYGAYANANGTTVALDAGAFKAAASSASAAKADIAATLALGSGIEIDADDEGYPVTVTLTGAAATGTIELTVLYVVD